MKLSLAEPKYFKDSISVISELVNEARFKVTPNAIELIAMDPANVAMVVYKLLASSFVEYNVKTEIEIAINLSNLKQILRRVKPNDVLSLELGENRLKVELKSGKTKRLFSIPIIELEEKEQKIPELNFTATVQIPSSVLNDAVEDVDIVAESVTFIVDPKRMIVQAEGDLSKAQIEIDSDEKTKISATEKVKSKYSIEYLKKMINGAKLADTVTLQLSKDYPLKLEYKTVDKVMLIFILAPRVEND